MARQLKEIGSPQIGTGVTFGPQSSGTNNRIVTRRYTVMVADRDTYAVSLINPTLYDEVFTGAVIVDQRFVEIPGNKTECVLERTFAEIPTEWDVYDDSVIAFPGVEESSLYSAQEFSWRGAGVSLRTQVRINRVFYLSRQSTIPTVPRFKVVDSDGVEQRVITDHTTPSSDEYLAMVLGRGEIVVDSQVKPWRGDISYRETVYALAQ